MSCWMTVAAVGVVVTGSNDDESAVVIATDADRNRLSHHLIGLCGTDKGTGGDQGRRAEQNLLHAILPIDSRTRHAVLQPILLPVPSAPTLGAPYSRCCVRASPTAD